MGKGRHLLLLSFQQQVPRAFLTGAPGATRISASVSVSVSVRFHLCAAASLQITKGGGPPDQTASQLIPDIIIAQIPVFQASFQDRWVP